ncbi:MAG: M1 family metallopeptidase [Acidobacteriota bacterium]
MFRAPVLSLVLLLVAAGSPAADTYPRQTGVDVLHYVFRLTLMTSAQPGIDGEADVTLAFAGDEVRDVALDLTSATGGTGMTVSGVSEAGRAVQFRHVNDRLWLTVAPPARAGDRRTFTVRYGGTPREGLRLLANIHGEPTAFSENWPNRARQWLPTIDHPHDKATGEFVVTTSSTYQVVANGLLVEEVDLGNGQRRTHWKQSVPIASWLYALGVARFAVHHAGTVAGVPLQTWVFPQDQTTGYALFEETSRRAMAFFTSRIGPYPYEKLANIQAAGLGGGTEHASAIFYGEEGVAAGRAPVVHEIAHQWFGNSVTERDWDDVWLSEGFATYFTLLFTEHDEGREAFVDGLKRSRTTVLQLERKLPDTPVIHRNLDDMRRVLNQFVYQKAGWVLHMLRQQIGAEAFWAGIRDYYRTYRDGNASTREFRQTVEAASGQELGWFFDQWLTRSGVPGVEGTWRYDAATKEIAVTLAQTQAEPYRLNVEVGLVWADSRQPRVERVALMGASATATFTTDAAPTDVVIDPRVWLLADAKPLRPR